MRAPQFIHEVWRGLCQHPRVSIGLLTAVGFLTIWQLLPSPQDITEATPTDSRYTGVVPNTASLEGAIGTMQHRIHEMDLVIAEQRQTIARLEQERQRQAAATQKQQRQEEARQAQQAARIEAALKRAEALAAAPPIPAVFQPAAPKLPPQPRPAPALRIIEPKVAPAPVLPPAAPWVFLPAGSVAKGRLINGVFATQIQGGGIPAEFTIDTDFASPQGTSVPLQGCRAVGKTRPVFTAARLEVEITRLACVLPDGRTFEQPIKGYVTGFDNVLGIPGIVDHRDPHILRQLLLAAAAAAPASAFRQVERTQSTSALGVSVTTTSDVGQDVARRIADLYLNRAEAFLPVVWVEPNQDVYLYLLNGITIEGLTASAGSPQTQQAVFD